MKLSSQQGQHVRIIPGGLLATRPHADLGCSAVTDEVDGDLAQDRQVARCRPIPNAAVIFSEGDIQDPMEPIFYGPMPADCLDQDLGVIAAKPPSTVSIKRPCGVVVSAQVSFSERKPACLSVIAARV